MTKLSVEIADKDPADVMTPEVFSLLKLCGGLRSTDVARNRPRSASCGIHRSPPG